MENTIENYSKWVPELSEEGRDHLEHLNASFDRRPALMRELRRFLGLTQTEVANLLGVTQSNVSKIEVRDDPSLSILARMAEAKGMRLKIVVEANDGSGKRDFAIG